MPLSPVKILIVDDNEDTCALLESIFEELYEVHSVHSGAACLATMLDSAYDLVLLDVNMPEINGYEVCRRLKNSPHTALIPVVFVSALVSTEERLRGYEVGADDYVTKPFLGDEITATVNRVLEHRLQTKAFEERSKEAMTTAFQAMSNSAELGQIIRFLQSSYTCKSLEQLANKLRETTDGFGLNCCLMFRLPLQTEFFGCKRGSIETKVFERFADGERILDFGVRTLINDERVSLLVRNMPLDQPDHYGRIKDNLVVLVNGTEARVKALEIEHQLQAERNRGLQAILLNSREKLKEIQRLVEKQKQNTKDVFFSINSKIESIIFGLGLDDRQEQAIISAIDKGVEELSLLTEYSVQVEQSFLGFVSDLDKLV